MRVLYLAGPINGCTDDEASGWRSLAKAALSDLYAIRDPMARDYRGIEDGLAAEIVEQDLDDIRESDVLLVYAERPSWGTAMEAWQAGMWGKEIVVVCSGPVSPWLRFVARRVFPDLTAAVEYLTAA